MEFESKCVQGSYSPKNGEPRVLPLAQSTTFYYENADKMAYVFDYPETGHLYTRISNPTIDAFEKKIAMLEDGVAALACSSGMAAETLAILNACSAGDNIISSSMVYGGTYNLFNVTLRRYGVETRFFDPDAPAEEIEKLIDDKTKIIYGETIANPAMTILDFDKFSKIADKYGLIFMVDNTLATPYLLKPKDHGAHVVLHSTTKYLDGHASCVGGIIVDLGNFKFQGNPRFEELFNQPDESYHGRTYSKDFGNATFAAKARCQMMRDFGSQMSPFNAYLTNLNAETLHLRMARHSENAQKIAELLEKHPQVEWVKYPGLKSDKYYDLAKKYYRGNGFGGMLVFGVKGGKEAAVKFQDALKFLSIVTHIADSRSSVLHPASTTHRQLSAEDLKACGVPENLIRLSIGIEDYKDIEADILQALEASKK